MKIRIWFIEEWKVRNMSELMLIHQKNIIELMPLFMLVG